MADHDKDMPRLTRRERVGLRVLGAVFAVLLMGSIPAWVRLSFVIADSIGR